MKFASYTFISFYNDLSSGDYDANFMSGYPRTWSIAGKYAPHLNAEALYAWGLYKSGFIRDIYFRQDRPGVAIFLECDSVDEAMNVMAEFPLAKAGLLSFECIPLGSFINWENLVMTPTY